MMCLLPISPQWWPHDVVPSRWPIPCSPWPVASNRVTCPSECATTIPHGYKAPFIGTSLTYECLNPLSPRGTQGVFTASSLSSKRKRPDNPRAHRRHLWYDDTDDTQVLMTIIQGLVTPTLHMGLATHTLQYTGTGYPYITHGTDTHK